MPDAKPRSLALITGASSGLGATFARALAARGYDLLLVARRKERLDALATELAASHGVRAEVLVADLIDAADLSRVEERIAATPELELLVNNAGFGTRGYFWESMADQDSMHRLHVMATMRLAQAALAAMTVRGHGAVINVSSVAGFINTGHTSYHSTKAWMNAFTEGLHLELKAAGSAVKVQALCPGFTITEFHDTMGADRKEVPQWLWMQADDVVRASLEGLDRGTLFVVPGWIYKVLVRLVPRLPRRLRERPIVRGIRRQSH